MINNLNVKARPSLFESLLAQYEEEIEDRSDSYIKCANCHHALTHEDRAISVAGSHSHIKINAYYKRFEFRCYREALGCAVEGPDESADSWFPGCVWQYLHCEACNYHLGWFFHGISDFYGIRADMILQD